jgi:rhodanese-related sulfurtransferase
MGKEMHGSHNHHLIEARPEANHGCRTLAPERYREAHIPGALNIPPEEIKELAPQLLPNKDAEIVTAL